MKWLAFTLGFAAIFSTGCSCGPNCNLAVCGACPLPISFTVSLAGEAGPVTVTGRGDVVCERIATGETQCTSSTAGPGEYRLVVSAPGHESQTVTFVLGGPPPGACCACMSSYSTDVDLFPPGFGDAGPRDAGPRDAGRSDASFDAAGDDAGALDAGELDVGPFDGGTCNEGAVRFIPSGAGPLEVGTLCDDVFVCLGSLGEGAAVMAASDRFVCASTSEAGCTGATCRYADPGGPSTLDQAELDAICAVTVALPSPDLVCMVYL